MKLNIGSLGMVALLILIVCASGCTNSNSNNTTSNTQTQQNGQSYQQTSNSGSIRIIATGPWTGNIQDSSGGRSVQGSGTQTFLLAKNPGTVSATIQKDNSKDQVINGTIQPDTSTLTVQIMTSGGNVIASQSTSVDAGVVSISANL